MPRSARRSAVHRPTDPSGSARIGAPSVRAARSATLRETGKGLGDPGTDPRAAHGGTRKRRPGSRLQLDRALHTQDPPRTRSYRSPASAPVNSGQGAEPAVPAQASWSKDPSLGPADLQDLAGVLAGDRVVC